MSRTIAAIFDNYRNAENAAREVKERGLRTDDISIVTKENEEAYSSDNNAATMSTMNNLGKTGTANRNNKGINDNISDGVVTGGILGGLAGLLIGAGSMVIPGLGIIAAAGPITGLLSGAVTGGIVGGLVDLGIPENKGKQYESDIKAGKVLFSMKIDDDKIDEISSVLRNNGAISIDTY